jgi:hypothetical protein
MDRPCSQNGHVQTTALYCAVSSNRTGTEDAHTTETCALLYRDRNGPRELGS